MRSPRFVTTICLIVSIFLIAGCSPAPAVDDPAQDPKITPEVIYKPVMIFYKRGEYLVPVAMRADSSQADAKTAVDILLSGIVPEGFENPLSDVILRSFSLDGDTVTLDLSDTFLTGPASEKRDQLVDTLMWCDNVSKVDLFVEGEAKENILTPPWAINLRIPKAPEGEVAEAPIFEPDPDDFLTLYFIDEETKKYLVPVTVKTDKIAVLDPVREGPPLPIEKATAALAHLTEVPQDLVGLVTIFPQHLQAKKVEIKESVAYVDVDGKLLVNMAGEIQNAQLAMETIIMTLTSIDGINEVQLFIDGKGYIIGNINISKPISRLKWFNSLE